MPRKVVRIALAGSVTLLATACGGSLTPGSPSPSISVSPSPASPTSATGGTGTTINGSGSPIPTTSPGITGSVTTGIATLMASGGVQTNQNMPLTSPAVYAPQPGTFVLNWASGAASFAMTGVTFVGTRPSSTVLQVFLSIHSSSGTFTFGSTDGSCQITVATANATNFVGSYSCPSVTDATGKVTVAVQGTFSATG
jgi:hypothetical protein